MKRILAIFLFLFIAFCGSAHAIEIVRQKNVATRIVFPIIDADGDTVTGAAGLDSEIDEFADGSNPTGFADCTNETTEIGTTGIYYLSLTSGELNQDYVVIQIKTTTSGAKTQHILIRTLIGDPLNLATTDDGGAINVTSGAVDTVTGVTNDVGITQAGADKVWSTTTRALTDKNGFRLSAIGVDDIWDELTSGHTTAGSYGKLLTDNINATISSRSSHSAADVWSVGTRTVTGGTIDTNNDKTGYTASTVSDKTGYTLSTAGMALLFTTDTTKTYADAVAGSVVKEIADNAGGSALTVQDIVDGVWDEPISGHLTSATTGAALNAAGSAGDPWSTPLPGAYGSGTAGYIIGNNINATISSRSSHSAADVWAVTTRVLTAGTNISLAKGTGITGFNDLSATQVNTEVDTALSDIKLDKLLNASTTLSSDVALGSVVGQLLDNGTSWSFDRSTDSLEAIRDRGDAAWTTGTLSASDVWTHSTRVLTANTNLNDPSAAVIADAVWDEARSGHTTAGSFGQGVASVQGNVTGSVGSVTSGVTVTTNNDKTGYSLTQSFPTNFSSLSIDSNGRVDLSKWLGSSPNALISGRVDSNAQVVGDKTGYSLTQGFPANFSAFAITVGGAVTVATNNDKTGYSLTSAQEDVIVDKVWDELRSAHVVSGSFGQGAASVQGNVTGSVTTITSGVTVSTNNDKTGYRLSASGVDDIWDEPQSGHASAGTFGKYLDSEISGISGLSAATIANAVWEETSNHTTAGTMGKKLNDASVAGNPWEASGICAGITAGQCLSGIKDSTDGDKEGSDYTGIEKTIRSQR